MQLYFISGQSPEMEDVWRLTHDVYVYEGYCEPQPDGLLKHHPHLDATYHTTVILAREAGRLIGTNSVTVDGPAKLHVDETFPVETERIRTECKQRGERLAASWRIVTDFHYRKTTELLCRVIDLTSVVINELLDIRTTLYTFHPKHERFYGGLLGFVTVAGPRSDETVAKNPAILMMTNRETFEAKFARIRKRLF